MTTAVESNSPGPVLIDVSDRIGTITMHRPDCRNAINPAMREGLRAAMRQLDADDDVDVMVLTGTDPAFSAGLDLRLIADAPQSMLSDGSRGSVSPFPERVKPLIGAINGPAITGGFELALGCDLRIASERAAFADTHARVGVMPGWGLTTLLADAVGRGRAREISLTGNFVNATQAEAWGLVNRVVPHDELMPAVRHLALDMIGNDQIGVRQMLATYASQQDAELADGWRLETEGAATFRQIRTPGSEVGDRRAAIIERGRGQL